MQSFESEHKVGIYFFWRTQQLNQKWGTASPIKYLDPVYKIPVSLRAHGNFSFTLTDPSAFFSTIVGSRDTFSVDELRMVLSSRLVQPLTDIFAKSGHGVNQIDSSRLELSEKVSVALNQDCKALGVALSDFRIEGTEFDEGTMSRISAMADIVMEGQAATSVGVDFAQLQQLKALRDAAKNPSGIAGAGIGLGAGIAMGQQFAQGFGANNPAASQQSSPALRLKNLKELLDAGVLSAQEYEAKKKELIALL
jgi:membrane protease subunit (stomatin/prohibitin family)